MLNMIFDTKKFDELHERKEPLHADLEPYLYDSQFGMTLHHPFVIGIDCDPERCAAINARYLMKKKEAGRALKNKAWDRYIFLHERPYRMQSLVRCTKKGLSGKAYWEAVASVWIDSENIHQNLARWKRLWASSQPFREHAMNVEERIRFEELPSTFTVWRGTQHKRSSNGLSWTLDHTRAKWFATRYARAGFLIEGVVKKNDAYAFFQGRKESEIVAVKVHILKTSECVPDQTPDDSRA